MQVKQVGHWQYELHVPHGSADGQWQVVDAENVVAIVDPNGAMREPGDYARLIAAAPELLAEAKELLRKARYQDGQATVLTQDCEALEAAIARAEGRE